MGSGDHTWVFRLAWQVLFYLLSILLAQSSLHLCFDPPIACLLSSPRLFCHNQPFYALRQDFRLSWSWLYSQECLRTPHLLAPTSQVIIGSASTPGYALFFLFSPMLVGLEPEPVWFHIILLWTAFTKNSPWCSDLSNGGGGGWGQTTVHPSTQTLSSKQVYSSILCHNCGSLCWNQYQNAHWRAYFSSTSISCFRSNPCFHIFQPSGRQVQVGIMFLLSRQVWEPWSQTGSLAAVRCLFRWWGLPQPLLWAQETHAWCACFVLLCHAMVQCHLKLVVLEGMNCLSFLPLSTIVLNPATTVCQHNVEYGKEGYYQLWLKVIVRGVRSGLQLF